MAKELSDVQNYSKIRLALCNSMMLMTEYSEARKSKMCTTSTVDTVQSRIIDIMCTTTPRSAHPALAVKQTLHTGLHTYERQLLSWQIGKQTSRQTGREANRQSKKDTYTDPTTSYPRPDMHPFICQVHLATGLLQAHLISYCNAKQAAHTLENIVIKVPLLLQPAWPALVVEITAGRDDV